MDVQSVFVSNNHTRISTTKWSTQIGHFFDSGRVKKHVRGPDLTVFPVSKAPDLVMLFIKNQGPSYSVLKLRMPDLLETSAMPSHLLFILLCQIPNLIPKCKAVLLNYYLIKPVTSLLPRLSKCQKNLVR